MGATRLGDGALLSWAQFGLLFYNFLHLFTLAVTRSRKMTSSWKTLCIHCWSGSVLRRLDSVESVESVESVKSEQMVSDSPQDDKPLEPGMLPVRTARGFDREISPRGNSEQGCKMTLVM